MPTQIIRRWLHDLRPEHKFYAAGTLLILLSVLIGTIFPTHKPTPQVILLLATMAFFVGFLMWGRSGIQTTWEHPIGRGFIIILHLFVVLLSAIMARSLVAAALGLPPQNFDITVTFIAFVMYIPTWALVISCILGIIGFAISFVATFLTAMNSSASGVATTLARGAGAFAICAYSFGVFDFTNRNQEALYPTARWIAWLGDFHHINAYPGIKSNERVRLLENGIVSIATVENNSVAIRVRRYEE